MARLDGSRTADHLRAAFAAEAQASRRFSYFAHKAEAEGYPDIAALFRSLADAETGHAFGHLDELAHVAEAAAGLVGASTEDNLKAAIEGESHDATEVYPRYARVARDEGFDEVADWFETVARAEKSHVSRLTHGLDTLG